ncbi:hypothetical protein BV898_01260 [Hypsibius exemplaris]|uniref:Protein quiver n=1 Tax=Hypsibius exemplaris TaxID=2072580 RepID=A0A1W0XC85_HYPEX|nr:hypothetical protein BV898_01260 [Hypsibius exemplaris]
MRRILVVSGVILLSIVAVSALKCYSCGVADHDHYNDPTNNGGCDVEIFNATAVGVAVIDCQTSCEVERNYFNFGGPGEGGPHKAIHLRRYCAAVKSDADKCNIRTAPGPANRVVEFCTCNSDFCNTMLPPVETPAPPTEKPPTLNCYACRYNADGAGPCEQDPFNVSAQGVEKVLCPHNCKVGTFTTAQGIVHTNRSCAEWWRPDGCDTRPMNGHGPTPDGSYTLCSCSTDFCNAFSPTNTTQLTDVTTQPTSNSSTAVPNNNNGSATAKQPLTGTLALAINNVLLLVFAYTVRLS